MQPRTQEHRGSPTPTRDCVSPVEIRPIEAGDAMEYIELLRRIDLETTFLAWEPGERELDVDTLRTRLEDADPSGTLRLLATRDQQPVGVLVCHRPSNRRFHHRADFAMAVLHQYQCQGIGQRLLEALCSWAAEHGITRLELTVMSHNRRAIALYHRVGFVPEGTKRGSIRVDGEPVDELVMAMHVTTTDTEEHE